MNDFIVGEKVYFFWTDCGKYCLSEATVIYPSSCYMQEGTIVSISSKKDYVHVYMEGEKELVQFSFECRETSFFRSKKESINAFMTALNSL